MLMELLLYEIFSIFYIKILLAKYLEKYLSYGLDIWYTDYVEVRCKLPD